MKKIIFVLLASFLLVGCDSTQSQTGSSELSEYSNYVYDDSIEYDYDSGFEWAEENSIDNFDDCQDQFGTGEAEDGCNDYVKDNYTGNETFFGYECTEDCSGHEAGYEWAAENNASDIYDCNGNSQSFNEGCEAYVNENY